MGSRVFLFAASPVLVVFLFVSMVGPGGPGGGPGPCGGLPRCPPLSGNQVAAAALTIAEHLQMCGGFDKCYDADMPVAVLAFWQLRCPLTATCYADWQNGNLQCVLYVDGAYGLAGDPLPATGNAIDFWGLYAQRAGWVEIPNGQGMPQPGDLLVFAGPTDAGHIAVVIAVQPDGVTFGEANGPAPLVYATLQGDTVLNPIAGTLLGVIRHVVSLPGTRAPHGSRRHLHPAGSA